LRPARARDGRLGRGVYGTRVRAATGEGTRDRCRVRRVLLPGSRLVPERARLRARPDGDAAGERNEGAQRGGRLATATATGAASWGGEPSRLSGNLLIAYRR